MNAPGQHGVVVTLDEIYKQVQATDDKLDRLTATVGEMVAINKRLDQHHDRLNAHGERLRKTEAQIAAQWIVVGVVITIIGALAVRAILGT